MRPPQSGEPPPSDFVVVLPAMRASCRSMVLEQVFETVLQSVGLGTNNLSQLCNGLQVLELRAESLHRRLQNSCGFDRMAEPTPKQAQQSAIDRCCC